jgi:hypothetical protein
MTAVLLVGCGQSGAVDLRSVGDDDDSNNNDNRHR